MPRRTTPLVNGEYYHIFNRGVEKRITFTNKRDYSHFIETAKYYRFASTPIKFSRYLKLSLADRLDFTKNAIVNVPQQIKIIAYTLMPNHFHFLIKQEMENGLSTFMKNVADSYTKYFNIKNERVGPLFQGQFKAVLINSNEQILHVSRYIHLNPFTSFVIRNREDLITYPWSSFRNYVSENKDQSDNLCDPNIILSSFNSKQRYKNFVFNQAEYQQKLKNIKHLLLE